MVEVLAVSWEVMGRSSILCPSSEGKSQAATQMSVDRKIASLFEEGRESGKLLEKEGRRVWKEM